VGTGTVTCAHGEMPLPAPATANLLQNLPVIQTAVESELTTPSGAAILSTLAKTAGPMPACTVHAVGYGAGARDIPQRPNVLRVMLGETTEHERDADVVEVLEANLDDMSPEYFGVIYDRLLSAGALDVWTTPIHMKKGRPALLLSAIAPPGMVAGVQDVLFDETTTFGIRLSSARRVKLPRETRQIDTPFGTVQLKISRRRGEVIRVKPEHDDCVRLAEQHGVPFSAVRQAALRAYQSENTAR
jgi:hypothetical protein